MALDQYQSRRKDNTDVIAELSRQNFVEMRDRVNSPWFRLKSEVEHALERHLDRMEALDQAARQTPPTKSTRRKK